MSRPLTANMLAALYAQETGEAVLILLTLTHADMTTIRVTSDAVETVSRGNTFQPFPFEVTMPDELEETPPEVRLRIDNVDRQIVIGVRSIQSGVIRVAMEVIMGGEPDDVQAGPITFDLSEVDADALYVEGRLNYRNVTDEPFPGDTVNPSTHPGLF